MTGVAEVAPVPNATECTAEVFLQTRGLPDVSRWASEFVKFANGSHQFQGVEVTLEGNVEPQDGVLKLLATPDRPEVIVGPLDHVDKVQFDFSEHRPRPATVTEQAAFAELVHRARSATGKLIVTGPLHQVAGGWELFVRVVGA